MTTPIVKKKAEALQDYGVLILDVDDTLLDRVAGSSRTGETYFESPAAVLLPKLIKHNIRTAIITGHGWDQLEDRLARPLVSDLDAEGIQPLPSQLFLYANRGLSRIRWEDGFHIANCLDDSYYVTGDTREKLKEIASEIVQTIRTSPLPEIQIRENAILSIRPVSYEIRSQIVEKGNQQLHSHGLDARFCFTAAGSSTIELAAKLADKTVAVADLFERISVTIGCSINDVERCSIAIGDEFYETGNDWCIPNSFPDLLCVSVSKTKDARADPKVLQVGEPQGLSGSRAAAMVLGELIKLLD